MPTILLSNHPGRQPASGAQIAPDMLMTILATLFDNGRLDDVDAVLTGYLPSAAHVSVCVHAIGLCRSRNPSVTVLCDPVLGDDPKGLYIDAAAAAAIRAELVPLAAILTPNRFELAWLSGMDVTDEASAVAAARSLASPLVVATSVPTGDHHLSTLAIEAADVARASVVKRAFAPNGTGDLLAAVFLSGYLAAGGTSARALAAAVDLVDTLLTASDGHAELQPSMRSSVWP